MAAAASATATAREGANREGQADVGPYTYYRLGDGRYGYVIGNMVSIVNDSDVATKEYHTRMEQLFSYMNERHFPPDLHRKVKKFFRRRFQESSALDDRKVLEGLSTKLRYEVSTFLTDFAAAVGRVDNGGAHAHVIC